MTDLRALLAEAADALRDPAQTYLMREALSWRIRDALGEPFAPVRAEHRWANDLCPRCGAWKAQSPGGLWYWWQTEALPGGLSGPLVQYNTEPPCDRRLER